MNASSNIERFDEALLERLTSKGFKIFPCRADKSPAATASTSPPMTSRPRRSNVSSGSALLDCARDLTGIAPPRLTP
jgi:hypothetical protein